MMSSLMDFARDNFGKMFLPYCPFVQSPSFRGAKQTRFEAGGWSPVGRPGQDIP